jgi:hypothetical protein
MKAKLAGRITSLRKEIEALRSQAHFFIKTDLELELLQEQVSSSKPLLHCARTTTSVMSSCCGAPAVKAST